MSDAEEIAALLKALAELASTAVLALADGSISVGDVAELAPRLIAAGQALAIVTQPDDPAAREARQAARRVAAASRVVLRAKRRAKRRARNL